VIRERPSPNCDGRGGTPVDILLLHYTGMPTAEAALARLCDAAAEVSAHYLIEEDGGVWQLVDESQRAWHAGAASWRGAANINARSIGIELVNPGHEFGYRAFPERQMTALVALAGDIVARHRIPAGHVLGHSDVAPRRKMDPGELFDWQRLATAGIGLWPQEADVCDTDPQAVRALLSRIGYETQDLFATIRAFQRHFRPARVNGRVDCETARRLAGLATLCAAPSSPTG
jgi:N-acetylmuramoyl-L-alanine amidase